VPFHEAEDAEVYMEVEVVGLALGLEKKGVEE